MATSAAESVPLLSPPTRLRGVWKSDRKMTFRLMKADAFGDRTKWFQKLFGKMVLRWGTKYVTSELDGHIVKERYEVVAVDASSVLIRQAAGELRQLHFVNDDLYFLVVGNGLCEYFRRVKSSS